MKNVFMEQQGRENPLSRRDFLKRMGVLAFSSSSLFYPSKKVRGLFRNDYPVKKGVVQTKGKMVLLPFDYQGVTLLPSRWQKQYASAREFYFNVSDDDILCGFRRAAGLPAPGKPLGGWASRDSSVIFGQWLQAMARTSSATGDEELRAKAVKLVEGWAKTLGPDGNPRMGHYPWEKMVGGLSDMVQYADYDEAARWLEKIVDWGIVHLDRTRTPAARTPWELHSGKPLEWYTLSENLYRAYLVTGKEKYKEFGDVWRYDHYWNKFALTNNPPDAHGVHAYSHCNSFSGAGMAYLLEGEERLLQMMQNFYDFLQNSQCYATGGFGPAERYVINDGALGDSLETRIDSFEAPCCTWASFKLAKYLMTFTGEARYGDWIELLLYNAIGAALPIFGNGQHFYYANYNLGGGRKIYSRSTYTCCSGTYFQNVVEYHNLIYFYDRDGVYVNLYLPSQLQWPARAGKAIIKMTTNYPEEEKINLSIQPEIPMKFKLHFRVPSWSKNMQIRINGLLVEAKPQPGYWTTIERMWSPGDRVEVIIPLFFRRVAIDKWHPQRVAIRRGPVVYAQQVVHKHMIALPQTNEELNDWLVPTDRPTIFKYKDQEQASQRDDFKPFYEFGHLESYRMYFDPKLRRVLW